MLSNQATTTEIKSLCATPLDDHLRVRQAGIRFEELLLSRPADDISLPLPFEQSDIRRAQDVYEQYETDLELEFSNRLLSGETQVQEYPLYDRFERLIGNEVSIARIKTSDRVLFIGSGPFPISPILIAERSGARVDCFDHSADACNISERVVENLGLSGQIRIFHRKGELVDLPTLSTPGDYGLYDVVFVALLAQPKEAILDQLWRSIGPEPRVILRYSEGNRSLLYRGMDLAQLDFGSRYRIESRCSASVGDPISTLLVRTDAQPSIFKL